MDKPREDANELLFNFSELFISKGLSSVRREVGVRGKVINGIVDDKETRLLGVLGKELGVRVAGTNDIDLGGKRKSEHHKVCRQ